MFGLLYCMSLSGYMLFEYSGYKCMLVMGYYIFNLVNGV